MSAAGSRPPASPDAVIDLRSDTVTRPTTAMRRAMAEAEVGDDLYGEDPSVNRLQEVIADLLGTEASLFVPTGTMANQIALQVLTRPGDDVLVSAGAHNMLFESGAAGALAGIQQTVIGTDGTFGPDDITGGYKPDNHNFAPTVAVSFENTHNVGGGIVWDPALMNSAMARARELELATHLDGARLWNAAVATGQSEKELARGFDTVSVCLSKGLGAPVGSLVCGSKERMHRAHRLRKMMGGSMRQSGVLAAAALHALEHHRQRLAQDHDNAAFLAAELNGVDGLSVDRERVHTNIVMVDLDGDRGSADAVAARARAAGLLCHPFGARRIRLVTHLDVARDQCARAVEILADAVSAD